MRNEKKLLMGATKDNTLVFASVTTSGDYFAVSFSEVRPFIASDDYLRERFRGQLECYDKADRYDLCERYDCKPSELEDEMFWQINHYGTIDEIMDISLYPESYNIKGVDDPVYFESDGCGQHDTRDRLIPIDPDFSAWLHDFWDAHHLKPISEADWTMVQELVSKYEEQLGEEGWIETWLTKLVEEGEI